MSTQEKTVTHVTLISNDCVASVGPRHGQTDLHRDIKEPAQSCSLKIDKGHEAEDGKLKSTKGRGRFSESL